MISRDAPLHALHRYTRSGDRCRPGQAGATSTCRRYVPFYDRSSCAYTALPGRRTTRAGGQDEGADATAQPTQIHPDDREGYLSAILADLRPDEGSIWTSWPEEGTSLLFHKRSIQHVQIRRNPVHGRMSGEISELMHSTPTSPHRHPHPRTQSYGLQLHAHHTLNIHAPLPLWSHTSPARTDDSVPRGRWTARPTC
jgi:hypothetical protein